MKTLKETYFLFMHYAKLSIKNPIWVIVALFQPVCYLFLYGPLLANLSQQAGISESQTIQVFIPGLLVMVAFFGSMFVGFAMIDDLKSGVIERLKVTPVSRLALLLGRSLRDAMTLIIQSFILIFLALIFDLQAELIGTFLTLVMMMLVGLFMAPMSYGIALTLKSEDAVGSIINFIAQPMLLLSGVLIPLSFAPHWLQYLSHINPLKYIVEANRALFAGNIYDVTVFKGLIILILLVTFSLLWGKRAYSKAL